MTNGANYITDSFSITQNHSNWIREQIELSPKTPKSFYVQKGLDLLIQNEKQKRLYDLAPALFYFMAGFALCVFGVIFLNTAKFFGIPWIYPLFIIACGFMIAIPGLVMAFREVEKWKSI